MNKISNRFSFNPKVKIGIGITWVLLAFIFQHIPVSKGASFSFASRICNSSLGQLGQTFSASARGDCQTVGLVLDISWLVIVASLALVAFGVYQIVRNSKAV